MNIKNVTNYVVRNDTLDQYLKEISKYKILTAQEEKDLFVRLEDAETEEEKTEIRNQIINSNLRLNFAIAKRYSTGDILPDLINVGVMGMYQAFEEGNFDWRRGTRWTTLAQYYIRRAITAYLSKENILVRPKNGMRIKPKVKKIEDDYFKKNGRNPSPIEVIDTLRREYGIDVKDEIDIYGSRFDSIDDYIGEDDDNTFERSGYFNERTSVSNEYEDKMNKDAVKESVGDAMKALDERERLIVSMAYGYGYTREYKDGEIGQKIGLTSERVRQIKKAAIKKMREAYFAAETK